MKEKCNRDLNKWFKWTIFPVQLLALLACITAGIINKIYFNVYTNIDLAIKATDLAEKVKRDYSQYLWAEMGLPL